jgi:hypothetical protein
LNKRKKRRPRPKETRGRPEKYPHDLYLEPLKNIWLSADQLCGKRLKMALPLWLPHYPEEYEELAPAVYQGLLGMSASTIEVFSNFKMSLKTGQTKPFSDCLHEYI